jgi:N6-L-threonylcarbamoyladenine synthase
VLSIGAPTFRQRNQRRAFYTLGIETSCDDTCVSLLYTDRDGQVINAVENKVTCANQHHGGIHPVEAVESHTQNISALVKKIWLSPNHPKLDLIAVTRGPGMKPCLSVGILFAKALSLSQGVPLVGVHHMQAHALAMQMQASMDLRTGRSKDPGPQYPFLALLYVLPQLPLCVITVGSHVPHTPSISLQAAMIK